MPSKTPIRSVWHIATKELRTGAVAYRSSPGIASVTVHALFPIKARCTRSKSAPDTFVGLSVSVTFFTLKGFFDLFSIFKQEKLQIERSSCMDSMFQYC